MSSTDGSPGLERARELLAAAGEILVLTGAGISADSGVPTFRGEGGLWKEHRPEDLATPGAFARDPRLVWEWYAWRRQVVAGCPPNPAHRALARWALARHGVHIVTQNVDGLHTEAARALTGVEAAEADDSESAPNETAGRRAAQRGEPAEPRRRTPAHPLELHGSLFRVRCTGCGRQQAHREPVDATSVATLPHCGECGSLLRPDVVWFGEALPESVISAAAAIARQADACLVIGTSAVVQPAAGLATAVAARGGALVEVNPEPTPLTPSARVSLRARAAVVVPDLIGLPVD